MEVSLTAKSQTLTLISCLSSSTTLSSPSRRFSPLQREFLGCGHRLRPPGLHSPSKCKKLGVRVQPNRFVFRASLYSQPVVILVAVATFSALTVIYFNFTRRKNQQQHSVPDLEHVKHIDALEEANTLLKQGNGNQSLYQEEIVLDTHTMEQKHTINNSHDDVYAFKSQEQISLVHGGNIITEASLSSGTDVVTSNSNSSVSTNELEEGLVGAELNSKPYELVDQPMSTVPIISGVNIIEEIKEDHKPTHSVSQAIDHHVSGYSGLLKDSYREELHTFYEENHGREKSLSNFRDAVSVSSHDIQHNNHFSLPRASVETSYHSSVTVSEEGQMPPIHYKDVPSSIRNSYVGVEVPRDMRNGLAPQNSQRVSHEAPEINGKNTNSKSDPAKELSRYNRLLRDGRLADCIELLESMEQQGLLNMDKIYHARFFNICKNQKAVKEAFRFARLIGNPTLSTFNMLLSVCATAQDSEGAFQVMRLVKKAGLKADCKLYTTLISSCAKSGKVDTMFEVFHEMVNAGVEPNLHTYGALIDGSARAGQVAKAFGAYGILRSKNVKPDRVVFNALISACGQSGAVDRAFDVLAEMRAEATPVDPDHVTVGALLKTCIQVGQFDRAHEVYKMMHQYKIKGTPEVYTLAVGSCSERGDLEFALSVYRDMKKNGVSPDEMFLSALIDVAGHAGKIDVAFEVLQEAKTQGIKLGNVTYGSLMGACSNSKSWEKALELYEEIKSAKLRPTVSSLNALVTALCDGDQLHKAAEILAEIKKAGVSPNIITYSILLVGCEKKDDLDVGYMLYSQAKGEGVGPNLVMCKCLIGMCLRRFEKAYALGEQVLSFESGKPEVNNKWTSMALKVYRDTIVCGVIPTMDAFSLLLGCLQFPRDISSRARMVENLGIRTDASRCSNLVPMIDGFGEYDPLSFSLLEEATSHGIVPSVSFKTSQMLVDARKMQIHTVEVYLLTILKGLKHRLAAGAKLPNINILLPVERTQFRSPKEDKEIKLAGRVGQAVGALLRRLGLRYQGNESTGKIRISGLSLKRWFQPKLAAPFSVIPPSGANSSDTRLGKGIADQQRDIRTSNLTVE